jgi:hypothetical protein
MNLTAQHLPPEAIMALLDGELASGEARTASEHIEDCPECAKLAEQLRGTSQSLSAWKVLTIPNRLEDSVTELAAIAASGVEIRKPKLFVRASFWNWKQWAALSAGSVAALLFVVAMSMPTKRGQTEVAKHAMPYIDAPRSEPNAGSAGILGDRDKVQGGVMGAMLGARAAAPQVEVRNGAPQLHENQVPRPMIARTVSLSMVVKDFARSRSSLDDIVARYHGYSAQLSASTAENAPRTLQASLRIPAPALPSAVSDLKTLGRVDRESQAGEEVTRQHEDLVVRLKNSHETEQRLRDILQQRTGKISDVLKVEEEITRVRGEIEQMEAEQKALEHRVDFATVELQLAEEYEAQLNPPAASVSTRIHNALVAGYQNASEMLLGVVLFFAEYGPALLIWLAILALPLALLWRRYRRMSAAV